MDKKIINIGDINKNPDKFKRYIDSDLTYDNIQLAINQAIENTNYDQDIINLNCNTIYNYFESGKFYNDLYSKLQQKIITNDCKKIFVNNGPNYVFLYEVDFILGFLLEGKYDHFLLDTFIKYTFGVYKECGFKSYIHDILNKSCMYINYLELYDYNNQVRMKIEISLDNGPLYEKLSSYYTKLTTK